MIRRRALGAALGVGWASEQVAAHDGRSSLHGTLVGASHRVGHRLREKSTGAFAGPRERADVVVVGSGASGLAAAVELERAGIGVTVLELEPRIGGTATWGEEGAVPHPWGAHYLPIPERGARTVLRLLEELGIVTGWDAAGRPQFRADLLCHAPEERLFFRGHWYQGLVPFGLLSASERSEVERFLDAMFRFRETRGRDGRPAFALPRDESSTDPELLALDAMTMASWLEREGYRTPILKWLVEYATRDDFGADLDACSAWAGIHYFAARRLDTEQIGEGSRFLVWPEGNGYLIRAMAERLAQEVRTNTLVTGVEIASDRVEVDFVDLGHERRGRISARALVLGVPGFIARRLLAGHGGERLLPSRVASPWIVANLHLERPLEPNRAWDSIIHGAKGLGYVDAGHQLGLGQAETVWTYFRALGARDAIASRKWLLRQSWGALASEVLADLHPAHPHLDRQVTRVDIMRWGHAMPRPVPGFLGASPFRVSPMVADRVAWAHVDQSGFALFEEAHSRGTHAAQAIARRLRGV